MFRAGGCIGRCCWDASGLLLFEVPVGCLHVFAAWQSFSRCSCRLREILVKEAVMRPFRKLQEGGVVCHAVVGDPHLGEGDVYYGDGGPDEVYGVDTAFGVMVEVPAEDRQGSFLRACVVVEYGMPWRREKKLQVVCTCACSCWWACLSGGVSSVGMCCGPVVRLGGGWWRLRGLPASGCGSCGGGGGCCVWCRPPSPRPLWRLHGGAMPPGWREWVWRWGSPCVLPMPW